MGKKSSLPLIYLIGMALVLVGCFLPLTSSSTFGFNGSSAFDAITSDGKGIVKIGSLLAFIGAVAGIVFCFVSVKGIPMRLISLIVSIVGGVYVIISYMGKSDFAKGVMKAAGKAFGTKPAIGLIVIIIGWVVALYAVLVKKN